MTVRALRLVCTVAAFAVLVGCRSAGSASPTPTEAAPPPTPPATLPDATAPVSTRAATRRTAVDGVSGGAAFRVEAVSAAATGPTMGGYRATSDAVRTLSAAQLRRLVALVNDPSGFDDGVIKRCRPGRSVGLTLRRAAGGDAAGLVLDFGCERLLVTDSGIDERWTASYFDPSRAAFVELVNDVFPGGIGIDGSGERRASEP